MRGYSGGTKGTLVGAFQPAPAFVTSKISTLVLVPPVSVNPDIAMTRPSPRAIVDAYTFLTPSISKPHTTPTTSRIASTAPTSWRWTSSGGIPSTVRLGPTLGVDAQYHVATHALSDLTVFASDRHRGSFSRDGASVDGSSANYLSAGIRGNRPINAGTDILGSIELCNHTGLTSDQALVTANAFMTAFTVGVNRHVGNVAWSPYARFRVGQVDTGVDKGSVTGFSIGANVLTRF